MLRQLLIQDWKKENPVCSHCGEGIDNADHTIGECIEWAEEREALREKIGADLGLPALVSSILDSRETWDAFAAFAEQVMRRKEEMERTRQQEEDNAAAPRRHSDGASDS